MHPPRPLAGLPPADLEAVARAWLVRRVADAPLGAAPVLAAPAFVARAPGLCGALLAALADDEALCALPAQAAVLRGLVDPRVPATGTAVQAVEQLRSAVLEVVLPETDPALHAALHDRLAHACSRLLDGVGERRRAAGEAITVLDARPTQDPRDEAAVEPGRASHDPRGALTAAAERLLAERVRFALLAVEIEDAALLPAGILATAEAALRAALPPGALQAPDGPGSLVVLARETDGCGLARALTQAVGAAAGHRGAPLRAAAGVAEHPGDGDTPEALLAHADGQLFAARAEGLPLA